MTTALLDRKSTRLNSSHLVISYAVFCLKKKKNITGAPGHGGDPVRAAGAAARHREPPDQSDRLAPARCAHPSGVCPVVFFFFFNDTATTEIYTLSLHDALPI